MTFDEFRVEGSSLSPDDCNNDYFEIGDEIKAQGESQNQPTRFCGTFTGIKLIDIENFKRLLFHTNKEGSDIGYSIHVRQVPCEFPSASTPSSRSTISSPPVVTSTNKPGFPEYSTKFTKSSTNHFSTYSPSSARPAFPESSSPKSRTDFPRYSSSSENSIIPVPEYGDVSEFPDYQGSGDSDFNVNDLRGPGKNDQIKSKLHASNFEKSTTQEIQRSSLPPEGMKKFENNAMNRNSSDQSDKATGTLLGRNSNTSVTTVLSESSVTEEMDILMNSNATAKQNKTSCSMTLHLSKTVRIRSPNYPSKYFNDVECSYQLKYDKEELCGLQITFDFFSVRCLSGDYLQIDDEKVCGLQQGTKLYPISQEGRTQIQFVSDSTATDTGFDIEIGKVLCKKENLDAEEMKKEKIIPLSSGEYFPPETLDFKQTNSLSSMLSPSLDKPQSLDDEVNVTNSDNKNKDDKIKFMVKPEIDIDISPKLVVASHINQPLIRPLNNYGAPPRQIFPPITSNNGEVEQPNIPSPVESRPLILRNPFVNSTKKNLGDTAFAPLIDGHSFGITPVQGLSIDQQHVQTNPRPKDPIILFDSNLTPIRNHGRPQLEPSHDHQIQFGPPLLNTPSTVQYNHLSITPHNHKFISPQNVRLPHSSPAGSYGAPQATPISINTQYVQSMPRPPAISQHQHINPNHNKRPLHSRPTISYGTPQAIPISVDTEYIKPNPGPRPPVAPQNQHIKTNKNQRLPYFRPFDSYGSPQAIPISIDAQYTHPSPSPRPPAIPQYQHTWPYLNQRPPLTHPNPRPPHPRPPHPKPNYNSNHKYNRVPAYKTHTKSKVPRFFDILGQMIDGKAHIARGVLDGKAQVLNSLFSFFADLTFNKPYKTRPDYPHGNPSYHAPSPAYGIPQPFARSFDNAVGTLRKEESIKNYLSLQGLPNVIRQLNDSCHLVKESDDDDLIMQSPNYPNDYYNTVDCLTNISLKKEVCYIKLILFDFILEDSMYCNHDFLLIENSENIEPQRLCGQHSGEEILLKNSGKDLKFQFKTDSTGTTRGFSIRFDAIYC